MKCIAIIPSGGIGSRFNSPIPKQYIKVLGKELIAYTLEVFQSSPSIDEIIIPADESYFDILHQIKEANKFTKIINIVVGGKERQDSVYNGLLSAQCKADDLIIVHDAARPLLTINLLENAIKQAKEFDSIVVGVKARDTLIQAEEMVEAYLDRSNVYYAQTPQIFKYSILNDAFNLANQTGFLGTDESMLVKNAKFPVKIVEGEFQNFKITTQSDLDLFENLLNIGG